MTIEANYQKVCRVMSVDIARTEAKLNALRVDLEDAQTSPTYAHYLAWYFDNVIEDYHKDGFYYGPRLSCGKFERRGAPPPYELGVYD
jgi:hypothetical protein